MAKKSSHVPNSSINVTNLERLIVNKTQEDSAGPPAPYVLRNHPLKTYGNFPDIHHAWDKV